MNAKVIRDTSAKVRPDIRVITRLVPPRGNLVQGQSELAIHPALASAAAEVINANQNHYSPAEGVSELREAVAQKINLLNGIKVDPKATPHELLITPGATGGLIAIAQTYLKNSSAIVFEPYYPYHGRILEELGGHTEVLQFALGKIRKAISGYGQYHSRERMDPGGFLIPPADAGGTDPK